MNHYFIGFLLKNEDARKISSTQTYLSNLLNRMDVDIIGKVLNFNTKFAYLGYLDHNSELIFKDKLNNIFEALSSKIKPNKSTYISYGITGSKTKKSISAIYKNEILEDVIVPYIRSYTDEMTQRTTIDDFIPHVAILRFNADDMGKIVKKDKNGKTLLDKIFLPKPDYFEIDSIQLLRGKTVITRQGAPSKYDDMNIEVIAQYKL